jgi:[ribosomal protein S5]-alanine N-acetyltransferase
LLAEAREAVDAQAAYGWLGDPVVMRFTPGGPDKSIAETTTRLATYREHQIAHGFSKWITLDRRTKLPIGDSGLLMLKDYGWIDPGLRLAQPCWGKGLATEMATAWVRTAFGELRLDRLRALVHPENVASIRVLPKLRFRDERRETIIDMNSILFLLDAEAHLT